MLMLEFLELVTCTYDSPTLTNAYTAEREDDGGGTISAMEEQSTLQPHSSAIYFVNTLINIGVLA